MKKLFTLIVAIITALTSGLGYVKAPEKTFNELCYYKGNQTNVSTDYKSIYDSYYGDMAIVTDTCKTEPYPASSPIAQPTTSLGYYWFFDEWLGFDFDNYSLSGKQIILPDTATIYNSSYSSNNSTEIQLLLKDKDILIVVKGMKCWWCCAERTTPSDGIYVHTGKDLKGTLMLKGSCIGIATDETFVSIYKRGSNGTFNQELTIENFYGGVY